MLGSASSNLAGGILVLSGGISTGTGGSSVEIKTATPTASGLGATFTVNSTNDAVDANPGDGVCASSVAECTLRAAIMEANVHAGSDTIIVPAGAYTLALTGPDEEASATGDLDVTDGVTIQGAGAATTIIDANAGTPPAGFVNGDDVTVNPLGAKVIALCVPSSRSVALV